MSNGKTGQQANPTPAQGAQGARTGSDGAPIRTFGGDAPSDAGFQQIDNTGGGLRYSKGTYTDRGPDEEAQADAKLKERVAQLQANAGRSAQLEALIKNRKAQISGDCKPAIDVYASAKNSQIVRRNSDGSWICSMDHLIKFEEADNYSMLDNEFRVFIEGSEVSNYLEGSLSWTLESTGGKNTCRFTLNNTQDAFIITPLNVCAGPYNTSAWRLSTYKRKGSSQQFGNNRPDRENWRVDEAAKWVIYKRKWEAISPADGTRQVDEVTGMWLYPLNPYSCIFNRHDTVRVFAKIPHISGALDKATRRRKGITTYEDFWMPVFTGFINDYSWNDSPIDGHRTVNITCYDYRGLMEKMRVRVYSAGIKDGDGQKPGAGTTTDSRTKTERKQGKVDIAKNPWADCAERTGAIWAQKLRGSYDRYSTSVTGTVNPYFYAKDVLLFTSTFEDLYALIFHHSLMIGTSNTPACGTAHQTDNKPAQGTRSQADVRSGAVSVAGKDFDGACAARVSTVTTAFIRNTSCEFISILGQIIEKLAIIHALTGTTNRITWGVDTGIDASQQQINNKVGKKAAANARNTTSKKGTPQKSGTGKAPAKLSGGERIVAVKVEAIAATATKPAGGQKSPDKGTANKTSATDPYSVIGKLDAVMNYLAKNRNDIVKYGAEYYVGTVWSGYFLGALNGLEYLSRNTRAGRTEAGGVTKSQYDEFQNTTLNAATQLSTVQMEINRIMNIPSNPLLGKDFQEGLPPPTFDSSKTKALYFGRLASIDDKLNGTNKTGKNLGPDKLPIKIVRSGTAGILKDSQNRAIARIYVDANEFDRLQKQKTMYEKQLEEIRKADAEATKQKPQGTNQAKQSEWLKKLQIPDFTLLNRLAADAAGANKNFVPGDNNVDIAQVIERLLQTSDGIEKAKREATLRVNKIIDEYLRRFNEAKSNAALQALYYLGNVGELLKKDGSKTTPPNTTTPTKFGTLNNILAEIDRLYQAYYSKLPQELQQGRGLANIKGFIEAVKQLQDDGKSKLARSKTVGEALLKYANFETRHAGIFADLVTRLEDQPHPLADKSFEQAVEYLCCEQQKIIPGNTTTKVSNYGSKEDRKSMDKWNRLILFGAIGRPLTYGEVSYVGSNSVSDYKNDLSPYNVFYHLLLPGSGTGADTIVQKNTGKVGINSLSLNYETRKSLLDEICTTLDYQFYVSGWGDLVFEFPHYNIFPEDFGPVFQGTYQVARDWKDATISEESQDIPTAWVITGLDTEKDVGASAEKSEAVKNYLKTVVFIAPILARRLGVRVENVNLRIPGVGAPTDPGVDFKQAISQLRMYGLFHIQRTLGRAHSLHVSIPFRPYYLPNRPLWYVARQRIGLTSAVTHTMNFPNGEATTDCTIQYTRFLFRDGTFRFMGGGARLPVNYANFFTGNSLRNERGDKVGIREGVGKKGLANPQGNRGSATPRASSSVGCGYELSARAKEANAFSSAVAAQWGGAFKLGFKITRGGASTGAAIDLLNGGIRESGGATPGSETVSSIDGKDVFRFVQKGFWYHQWARGGKDVSISGFGYLRRFEAGGLVGYEQSYSAALSTKKDAEHGGWDLFTPIGTKAFAPVPLYRARTTLCTKYFHGNAYAYYNLGTTAKIPKEIEPFIADTKVIKSGKYYAIKIATDAYALWKTLGGAESGIEARRCSGGLIITCSGYVQLPYLDNGGRVWAELMYVHMHDVTRINGKVLGGKIRKGTNDQPLLNQGDVVGICGSSGTDNPHLHFTMILYPAKIQTQADAEQYKVALAANKEFIDAQLRAIGGFYKGFNGTDPRRDLPNLNATADKHWQTTFAARKLNKKPGQVTVGDVVKFYQRRRTYQDYVPRSPFSRETKKRGVWVNPAFYFLPSQLIEHDKNGKWLKYKKFNQFDVYGDYAAKVASSAQGAEEIEKAKRSVCGQVASRWKELVQAEIRACELSSAAKAVYVYGKTLISTFSTDKAAAAKKGAYWKYYSECVAPIKADEQKLQYFAYAYDPKKHPDKLRYWLRSDIMNRYAENQVMGLNKEGMSDVRKQLAQGTNLIPVVR